MRSYHKPLDGFPSLIQSNLFAILKFSGNFLMSLLLSFQQPHLNFSNGADTDRPIEMKGCIVGYVEHCLLVSWDSLNINEQTRVQTSSIMFRRKIDSDTIQLFQVSWIVLTHPKCKLVLSLKWNYVCWQNISDWVKVLILWLLSISVKIYQLFQSPTTNIVLNKKFKASLVMSHWTRCNRSFHFIKLEIFTRKSSVWCISEVQVCGRLSPSSLH